MSKPEEDTVLFFDELYAVCKVSMQLCVNSILLVTDSWLSFTLQ